MKKYLMVILLGGLVSSVWAYDSYDLDVWEALCFSYSKHAAIYCNDTGVEYGRRKNYVKARELYKRGCDLGDKTSCNNLKRLEKKLGASSKK